MKIIFLDVDGVLNCATTKERVRDLLFVEDRKIQLLKELVDETGATIILSSTWRFGFENPNLYPELLELENKLAQFKTPSTSRKMIFMTCVPSAFLRQFHEPTVPIIPVCWKVKSLCRCPLLSLHPRGCQNPYCI